MVGAFGLYWGGIRFESLSTHHCWSLNKSFIPSLVVWSMTKKITHLAEQSKTKRATVSKKDLCDLEQVTLKPQLQVHHYLTTWLQIWYHSLLWGDCIRKGADLEKQICLFGVHPAVMEKLTPLLIVIIVNFHCIIDVFNNALLCGSIPFDTCIVTNNIRNLGTISLRISRCQTLA